MKSVRQPPVEAEVEEIDPVPIDSADKDAVDTKATDPTAKAFVKEEVDREDAKATLDVVAVDKEETTKAIDAVFKTQILVPFLGMMATRGVSAVPTDTMMSGLHRTEVITTINAVEEEAISSNAVKQTPFKRIHGISAPPLLHQLKSTVNRIIIQSWRMM